MLTSYLYEEGQFYQGTDESVLKSAVWLDLVDPTDEDRSTVARVLGQTLPEPDDVEEIEATARFFVAEDGMHLHTLFMHESEGQLRNTSVAFTLTDRQLVTLREREVPAFRLFRMRTRRGLSETGDPLDVMLSLFEIKIDDLADTLEEVYQGLEDVSARVLEKSEANMEDELDGLARYEDVNGKVRLCLMDAQRALTFLVRNGDMDTAMAQRARELQRDIESLLPHNTFVFDKINFLMDAAQGFINIQQNQVIKTFSIAAVVFLPPTLVASIYGMNFRLMPELDWSFGYPAALVLMVLSGIAPYLYFKHKGWL